VEVGFCESPPNNATNLRHIPILPKWDVLAERDKPPLDWRLAGRDAIFKCDNGVLLLDISALRQLYR
jgi:hypothetical protein